MLPCLVRGYCKAFEEYNNVFNCGFLFSFGVLDGVSGGHKLCLTHQSALA